MRNDIKPEDFISKDKCCVIAPAGCGKTQLIADSLSFHKTGRVLILTHTHAGVKSLIDRIRKNNISTRIYDLNTIDGFALNYAGSYPGSFSKAIIKEDGTINYVKARERAIDIIKTSWGRKIILASYNRLIVDEYQDCSRSQHELIITIGNIITSHIVGDPLQGIFDFDKVDPIINWDIEIPKFFPVIETINTPWRWDSTNPEMGKWLIEIRDHIQRSEDINLCKLPRGVNCISKSPRVETGILYKALKYPGSVVGIQKWPNLAHDVAKRLGGLYLSMEEVEGKELLKFCKDYTKKDSLGAILLLIELIKKCITKVDDKLGQVFSKLIGNSVCKESHTHYPLFVQFKKLGEGYGVQVIPEILHYIEKEANSHIYRKELWDDLIKTVILFQNSEIQSLSDCARIIRDKGRIIGRYVPLKVISRTVLIKGLEFDHSVIIDADILPRKELYVALTRARITMTLIASNTAIKIK